MCDFACFSIEIDEEVSEDDQEGDTKEKNNEDDTC